MTVAQDDVPEARQCDLLRWTEGTIIGDIEGGHTAGTDKVRSNHQLAGRLAARIHDHGQRWQRPSGFTRPHMDFDGLIGERAYLGLYAACALPENLLRDGDTVRIIDFDDCGFGWHVMDVATSLMFLLGEPHYDVALAGFVEGYRSVRPLPDAHLELLSVFFLARAMTYVGWAGSRPEAPIRQEKGSWLVESTLAMAEQLLAQAT